MLVRVGWMFFIGLHSSPSQAENSKGMEFMELSSLLQGLPCQTGVLHL